MTDPYSPSPELVEAVWQAFDPVEWGDTPDPGFTLTAAVSFRHPDGHPELVPWEQVRELVDAASRLCDVLQAGETVLAPYPHELLAALAPFTQENRT